MNSTTTESPNSLKDSDIVIIASVVGGVAGLIALVIVFLLICQRFIRRDPHVEERKQMINHFGSGHNSFLSHDYNPQQTYLYDNNVGNTLEFRERPPLAPTRSRSFQERRDVVGNGYDSKGFYDTHVRRSGSLDFGQMRLWDNKFPDSARVQQNPEPIRRLPDARGPENHVATLPSGNRLPAYHVPRPIVDSRFEPLWQGSGYM
ncbi:uncharacterized protein LOC135463084 [Liolophura sinensis]|uniref:uncharacterized protein LOC135463084 n=1 Tax=Liolophura sinensis TaxID=3198878 RepID=UPI0031598BEB